MKPRRKIATALTWPLGMSWTTLHYIWRILPVYRTEREGTLPADLPPPLPDDVSHEHVQTPEDGAGPLFHRVYSSAIAGSEMGAEELAALLAGDPNRVAPWQISRFRKTRGEDGQMRVGDELLVHMPGPWNGPVRTVEVRPDGFRFATLDGHLRRARSNGASGTTGNCASPWSRGRAAGTSCRRSRTTACGWRRRSSSTCGRPCASGCPGSRVGVWRMASRS